MATGLAIGGALFSGSARKKAAAAQTRAAEGAAVQSVMTANTLLENARIARQNAVIARQRTELQVGDIRRAGKEAESTQRSVVGASGVKAVGSAADVIREGRRFTAEDIMITRILGEDVAQQYLQEGQRLTQEAQQTVFSGALGVESARADARAAKFEAGASLLTAGVSAFPGIKTGISKFSQGLKRRSAFNTAMKAAGR